MATSLSEVKDGIQRTEARLAKLRAQEEALAKSDLLIDALALANARIEIVRLQQARVSLEGAEVQAQAEAIEEELHAAIAEEGLSEDPTALSPKQKGLMTRLEKTKKKAAANDWRVRWHGLNRRIATLQTEVETVATDPALRAERQARAEEIRAELNRVDREVIRPLAAEWAAEVKAWEQIERGSGGAVMVGRHDVPPFPIPPVGRQRKPLPVQADPDADQDPTIRSDAKVQVLGSTITDAD